MRAGEYILRCHTAAHVNGGMQALYTINASAVVTAAALNGAKTPSGSSVISALAFLSQVLLVPANGPGVIHGITRSSRLKHAHSGDR